MKPRYVIQNMRIRGWEDIGYPAGDSDEEAIAVFNEFIDRKKLSTSATNIRGQFRLIKRTQVILVEDVMESL